MNIEIKIVDYINLSVRRSFNNLKVGVMKIEAHSGL